MKININIRVLSVGLLLLFVTLFSNSLNAQDQVMLTGTIIDSQTDEPIPGVNVVEINENDRIIGGGITDFDGNFIIPITSNGNRILISFIGYKAQKITITELKQKGSVKLVPDVQSIDEVQVVGEVIKSETDGFMTLTEREKTTASVKIDLKEVENVSASSVAESIQGKLAGVDISASSGDPGAGLQIQVRGNTSLFGEDTSPLIVVNGLPYELETGGFDFSTNDVNEYSQLLDIAVEDILSLEVKKDAASAAVYGGAAANGVILITTKRGVKGKPRIEYSLKTAWKNQPDPIPMLNGDQYSTMMLEALFNANNGLALQMPEELSYDPNYDFFHEYSQNTDWMDEITQQGFSQSHNLAISGGGEQSRYRIATGYYDEKGTTLGTGLQRFTSNLSLDYNISKNTMLTADFRYTHVEQDKVWPYANNKPQLRNRAYRKAPNMSIYEWAYDPILDKDVETDVYFSPEDNYQGNGAIYYNPVAMANEAFRRLESEALRASLSLNVNIGKGFGIRSYVVSSMTNKENRTWLPQSVTGQRFVDNTTNVASYSDEKAIGIQHRTNFSYNKKFSASGLASLLGANPEDNTHSVKLVTAYEIKINNKVGVFGGASNTASGLENYTTPSRILGYGSGEGDRRRGAALVTGHYGLFSKYFVQGTVRSDADSRFSEHSRWEVFPSYGLSWNFGEERLIKNLKVLTFGKFRYSWGRNGSLPDNISYYGTFGSASSYIDMQASDPNNLQLDNLNYAITTQKNIGIDLTFFKKIDFNIDLYNKLTEDIIIEGYQIPSSTGYSALARGNFGSISNKGIEVSTSIKAFKNKDWDITINANISTNKNEIEWLPENFSPTEGDITSNGQYYRQLVVGQPVGAFYGYRYLGVYSRDEDNFLLDDDGNVIKNPDGTLRKLTFADGTEFKGGDAIYEDINKDGVIDRYDVVFLGHPSPDYYGGFGFNVKYKGFFVNTHFQYNVGMEVFNRARMVTESMYSRDNQSVAVLNRWRKQGDVTDIPRALYQEGYNFLGSDRFIEDNSYLRFKTLTLGYNVPKNIGDRIGLNSARLYVTFYNLYTWTDYKGPDPEVGNGRTTKWSNIGVDDGRTPPPSNVTFGINVKF